jgi:hypothetical protein
MGSFVLRIIVIECCSAGGCLLEEASEHCFLSIKVLFWCCGFIYCVVQLLFSTTFLFHAIIIDSVPYNTTIDPHDLISKFDVVSLFTKIPIDEAMEATQNVIDVGISKLIEVCLRSIFFSFQGEFYEHASRWLWDLHSPPL